MHAQDRVWEHVTRLAPQAAVARPLMALQGFFDDSYDRDGVFVLAGYVATVETWAAFARDWEATLSWGLRDERGFYFHMTEMAQSPERMGRVGAFFRVIEAHDLTAISMKIDVSDLHRAIQRLWVMGKRLDFGVMRHPHVMAFTCLMQGFYQQRAELAQFIGPDERVDFILDEHCQDQYMLGAWADYIRSKPDEVATPIGRLPRFEDDREFLPLQAADFLAWWMRKWYAEGRVQNGELKPATEWFASLKPQNLIIIEQDEDRLARTLGSFVNLPKGSGLVVYDDKFPGGLRC